MSFVIPRNVILCLIYKHLMDKILTAKEKVDRNDFFKLQTRNFHNTRGHSYKLETTRSRLELRRNFFSQRVTSHRNKLSETVVQAETVTLLCYAPDVEQIKMMMLMTFKNILDNEWAGTLSSC